MKKLFYLLLALPLVFASCDTLFPEQKQEPDTPETPDTPPTPPAPEYVMDVKLAAAERIPSAEAGLEDNQFALYFIDDAENTELGIILEGAEGETILQAGEYSNEKQTLWAEACEMYTYEPEGEYSFVDGSAVVALEGETYTFDITLKDKDEALYHFTYEGVVLNMEPAEKPEATTFEPVYVEAYRAQNWDLGNFELDLYINNELYHSLDMQDMVNPNDDHLSAGVYSMDEGSITSWSNFIWNLETGEGAFITDAKITITHFEDGTTNLKGFIESEYGDHLDIDWTGVVAGFVFGGATPEPPTPGEGTDFVAPYFACEYYSAGEMGTPANNYWIILSDDEACNPNAPASYATYIALDLYSALEQDSLPLGTYTFDADDSGADGVLGYYYSYAMVMGDGAPASWYGFSDGTVTVSEGKIYAELTREDNGGTVTVTYEGDLTFGGSSEGGDTGDSTPVEGDIEFDITGAGIHAYYYGDWYGVGADLWWVTVFEDDANKSGIYLQFELLVDPTYDDYRGTYTALNDESTSYFATFVPGEISNGSLSGTWYAEVDGGNISGAYAPIVDGTVEVVFNGDGSKTVVLDCVDDLGNKITGTASCAPAAETLSAGRSMNLIPVKRSLVVR